MKKKEKEYQDVLKMRDEEHKKEQARINEERKNFSDQCLNELKKNANNYKAQVDILNTEISNLKVTHEKQIQTFVHQNILNQTHHETFLKARAQEKENAEKLLQDNITNLKEEIKKIKRTCVFCYSADPQGPCYKRSHMPAGYGLWSEDYYFCMYCKIFVLQLQRRTRWL